MKKTRRAVLIFTVFLISLLGGMTAYAADLIWPTTTYQINCLYYYKDGTRHSCGYGDRYTSGMDIAAVYGSDCIAADSGTVVTSRNLGDRSYGQYLEIQHSDGTRTLYAHLSARYVSAGQSVTRGQVIGKTGESGNAGGAHLHFEYSGGDPWKNVFRYKYLTSISFQKNCYSNNKTYNNDSFICDWISKYYVLKGDTYVWNGGDPVGAVDRITGGEGTVTVVGWAYDLDDLNSSLRVDVYIGGPAGSGAPGYSITAGNESADLGLAGNHRFADIIETDLTGKQDVYLYAINIGGGSNNTLIGSGSVDIASKKKSICLDKTSSVVYVGSSITLEATVTGLTGEVTWKSSNKSVATVSSGGKVTGVKTGKAAIKASCGKVSATCNVTVKKPTTKLNIAKTTIYVGQTARLTATVAGPSKKAVWFSSKPSVATVSSSGKITGRKKGTATITVIANKKKATCKVTVKNPSISLSPRKKTVYVGGRFTIKATVRGASSKVSWSSSNKKVASVSKKGVVTAKKSGQAVITAKANGKKAICVVTVEKVSLAVSPSKKSINVGDSFTINASYKGPSQTILWRTSNSSVATVSNGVVTGTGGGTAVITASAGGKTASCTVTVKKLVIGYYKVFTESKTWADAEAYCESLGGHLATITSAAEQAYIVSAVLKDAGDHDFFIGIKDDWTRWVTGEPVSYTNWGSNEPDNYNGQNRGAICNGVRSGSNNKGRYYIAKGQWDDQFDNRFYFICEWDSKAAYDRYLSQSGQ